MNRRDLLKLLLAVPTATLFPKPKLDRFVIEPKENFRFDQRQYHGTWEFKTPATHPETHGWLLIGSSWNKEIWIDPKPRE